MTSKIDVFMISMAIVFIIASIIILRWGIKTYEKRWEDKLLIISSTSLLIAGITLVVVASVYLIN
jgi:isoprenylcysteine carboxyl methyltransferase (ICMT) family protein YpbQ